MSNQQVFQTIIDTYESARPGYPDGLFSDILSFTGLGPGATVLEIGAGPGQATDFFVKNGYRITALEISGTAGTASAAEICLFPEFQHRLLEI